MENKKLTIESIQKEFLLSEKPSGNYSCPHFISPKTADLIAKSMNVSLDEDALKALAEVSENFAIEILRLADKKNLTKNDIRGVVINSKME